MSIVPAWLEFDFVQQKQADVFCSIPTDHHSYEQKLCVCHGWQNPITTFVRLWSEENDWQLQRVPKGRGVVFVVLERNGGHLAMTCTFVYDCDKKQLMISPVHWDLGLGPNTICEHDCFLCDKISGMCIICVCVSPFFFFFFRSRRWAANKFKIAKSWTQPSWVSQSDWILLLTLDQVLWIDSDTVSHTQLQRRCRCSGRSNETINVFDSQMHRNHGHVPHKPDVNLWVPMKPSTVESRSLSARNFRTVLTGNQATFAEAALFWRRSFLGLFKLFCKHDHG